jgi:hypothetical protein
MGKPGCITETVGSWMAFEINVAPSIPRVWSAQNSKGLTRSEFQEQGRQINSALMIYVTFLKSYENIGKVAVTIEQVNQESPTETVELDGWHSSHTSVSHTERIKNNPGRNLLRFELLAAEKNSKPPRGTNKFKVLIVVVC